MVWGRIAIKPYKYNNFNAHASLHITYTVVWKYMSHQTTQKQWFECPRLTKRYVYYSLGNTRLTKHHKSNGSRAHGSPNDTYTMVVGRMAHQTLQIQLLYCQLLTERYIYDCGGAHCRRWLTQRYISKGLRHMARKTSQIQLFSWFHRFHTFTCFPCFPGFPCCRVFCLCFCFL